MKANLKWERFLKRFQEPIPKEIGKPLNREFKEGLPRPKGFPSAYLAMFGRPKKLSKWGFILRNDIPGRVVKIL